MNRVILLIVTGLFTFTASAVWAAEVDPEGPGWRLINEGPPGNRLYMTPVPMEQAGEDIMRVWLKVETEAANSPSPMLFLNELDCADGRIKRLEVRLYNPTCAAAGEPVQLMSFEGKWDKPSIGNEERLLEAACKKEGSGSL